MGNRSLHPWLEGRFDLFTLEDFDDIAVFYVVVVSNGEQQLAFSTESGFGHAGRVDAATLGGGPFTHYSLQGLQKKFAHFARHFYYVLCALSEAFV